LVRAGPEGVYWRAADGVEVRVASAEQDTERRHLRSGVTPVVRALFGVFEGKVRSRALSRS
jgi:hypothetical protein